MTNIILPGLTTKKTLLNLTYTSIGQSARQMPAAVRWSWASFALQSKLIKGGYIGDGTIMGLIKGDTRSLDYGSFALAYLLLP